MEWTGDEESEPDCPAGNSAVILNLSESSSAVAYEYDAVDIALVTAVYPGIAALGLLINAAFLLAFVRVKYMRTLTNLYLSSMAISDIMFLVTGSGFGLWKFLSTPVISDFSILGGVHGCQATQFANVVPIFASTFLVTVLAVERYVAICRPILHLKINTKRRTLTLIALAWILSVMMAACLSPSNVIYVVTCVIWPEEEHYRDFPDTIARCTTTKEAMPVAQILAAIGLIVPFWITLAITTVMYTLIVRKLYRRDRKLPNSQAATRTRNRKTRDHVAKMLVKAGTLFFALTTPRTVVTMYYYVVYFTGVPPPTPHLTFIIYTSTNILIYVNSITNPIVYAFSNIRYRKAIVMAFSLREKSLTINAISSE